MTMDPDLIGLMSLNNEENLDTDRYAEENAMWTQKEIQVMCLWPMEHGSLQLSPEARAEHETDSP